VDVEQIKQHQSHVWSKGDYSVLAWMLQPAANALRDACAVSAGQEVVDVAAGSGNFALACAELGARVVATDIAPGMIELGRERSRAEGYEIEWREADAEDLPFEDARFDCAGSVFGAMIAPRPRVAATELFRVVRPGGTVGMTAWSPGGLIPELSEIGGRYIQAPPDLPAPHDWADEDTARERFGGLAGAVEFEQRSLAFEAESVDALYEMFDRTSPPQVAAREALPAEQFEALAAELRELLERRNVAEDGSCRIDADYAIIVARKRG
jgi:ubiquinone/menaquinone biosynthesis C-methylase UbiE